MHLNGARANNSSMHPPRHRSGGASGSAATPARGSVAPVHRGPQATPFHAHAVSAPHPPSHAALLIDFDNVTMGIRSDLQTELKNLLSSAIVKGKVSVQRAYADWRRYPQYIVPLSEASIDLIFAPAYGSSKKNATDIRLAIDALELVFTRPEIATFILLSGDSDFSSLVIKLKEYGKYVIGVGIRESSSDLLVQNCDEYYSYNALAGLVKSGEEEYVKWDPWNLCSEAVRRMKQNGDVMRADRLKQVMQQIDPSFDEGNVGMAKFSKFVAEAAQRGLLSLKKLDNGQIEIDLPHKDLAPAPRAAIAAEAKTERGRRGGRGRRGRGGRDRGRARVEGAPTSVDMSATTDSIAAKLDAAAAAQPAPADIQLAPTTLSSGVPVLRRAALGRRGLRGRHIPPPPPELLAVGVVDLGPPLLPVEPGDNGDRTAAAAPSRPRSRRGIRTRTVVAATADRAAAAVPAKRRPRTRGGRKKAAPPESTG